MKKNYQTIELEGFTYYHFDWEKWYTLRENSRFSNQSISNLCGVNHGKTSRWFKEETIPVVQFLKICNYLGLRPSYFIYTVAKDKNIIKRTIFKFF